MRKISTTLIALVLALISLGIVVLASVSSVRGAAAYNDPQYYLNRQLIWLFIAMVAGVGISKFDYHYWKKLALPLAGISILLLIAVIIPGIGTEINGSYRWLRVGPLSFQPSEAAKFSMVIMMSAWLSQIGSKVDNFLHGLVIPMAGLGVLVGLLMMEPDFGTTALSAAVCMTMLFAAGTRISYLTVVGVTGSGLFTVMLMLNQNRWARIMAFLFQDNPDFQDKGYHLAQSKIAFINGGLTGVGLGNSIQKHLYLPEAHTDFIYAIIGEELGFVATLGVVLAFLALLYCGIYIAIKAQDQFGKFLAFGFTLLIVLQAFINIAVVTGCLPTKGIALPYISYGGSSLLVSVVCAAVLLNVAAHSTGGKDVHTRPIKDKMRRL